MLRAIQSLYNHQEIETLQKKLSTLESKMIELRKSIWKGAPSTRFAGSVSQRLRDDHTDLTKAVRENQTQHRDLSKLSLKELCLEAHRIMLELERLGATPKLDEGLKTDIQQTVLDKELSRWEEID